MLQVSKILVKNTLITEYYNKKIKPGKGNQRTVFSVVNKVLHEGRLSFQILSTQIKYGRYYNNFFCQKIINIYDGFPSSTLLQDIRLVEESCMSMLDPFEPFTETDIRQLLEKSSNALCPVDPMPT